MTTAAAFDMRLSGRSLGSLEQVVDFAEEEFGATGLIEELEGELRASGLLLHFQSIAGIGGEHKQLALRHFILNGFSELEAVFSGHGDVAEEEAGSEGPGAIEAVYG